MIQVNGQYIKENVTEIDRVLEEYQVAQANLFQQLRNACISWQDGNSVNFNDFVGKEKLETETFVELLVNRRNLYNTIYHYYNDIGNKISCNLDVSEEMITSAGNCKDTCDALITQASNIDYDLSIAISNLNDAKVKLTNASANISKYYNNVKNIENNILTAIRTIDELIVKEFDFQFGVIKHDADNIVDLSALTKDIELTNYYSGEESTDNDLLFSKFKLMDGDYKSDSNSKELMSSIDALNSNSKDIIAKRAKYAEVLSVALSNYKEAHAVITEALDNKDE